MHNKINIKAYLSAADKFWIGGQLRSLRQSQGLGIPEAARKTNTTQSQILAIESGSQGPFGSTENYVQGILTYASLAEISPESALGAKLDELANIMGGSLKDQSAASGIDTLMQSSLTSASTRLPSGKIRSKRVWLLSFAVCAFALLILVAMDVVPIKEQFKSATESSSNIEKSTETSIQASSEQITTSTQPPTQKTEPVPAEKDAATEKDIQTTSSKPEPDAQPGAAATSIHIKFSGPCWIQATTQDGKTSERVYGAGDQLELDSSKLKYLVIGNVETVNATNRQGKPLNLKPFANQTSKVARLKEQELGGLIRERN